MKIKRIVPVLFFAALAACEINLHLPKSSFDVPVPAQPGTLSDTTKLDTISIQSNNVPNIPDELPTEFATTKIKLRQLQHADSAGMFIVGDYSPRGRPIWTDSIRFINGKLVVAGDTVMVRDDGIICTGSYSEMMLHIPPPTDSCQMFLIDDTNLLFNWDPVDELWTAVYHDLIIVRENAHGRTHAPALGAYFDENTGHYEISRGDSLPTHVYRLWRAATKA